MTLQVNESFPTSECRWCFVHLGRECKFFRSVKRSSFLSIEMLACMVFVSITMPRNVRRVVGPSTLDVLTGILRFWQSESMAAKLPEHLQDYGVPAMKKSSR